MLLNITPQLPHSQQRSRPSFHVPICVTRGIAKRLSLELNFKWDRSLPQSAPSHAWLLLCSSQYWAIPLFFWKSYLCPEYTRLFQKDWEKRFRTTNKGQTTCRWVLKLCRHNRWWEFAMGMWFSMGLKGVTCFVVPMLGYPFAIIYKTQPPSFPFKSVVWRLWDPGLFEMKGCRMSNLVSTCTI